MSRLRSIFGVHLQEWGARFVVVLLVVGLPLAAFAYAQKGEASPEQFVEIRARMPEQGGWSVASLTTPAGEPLRLRLVSDDVVHSFHIGKSDHPAIDLLPGKPVETTLTFDEPGTYTFYCTRWCGPNHWRMRGTIDVLPKQGALTPSIGEEAQPLYATLGIDIDAPHPARATPGEMPSAASGAALGVVLPQKYLSQTFYRAHSPAEAWDLLRRDPTTQELGDQDVWNLVAYLWSQNTNPEALQAGKELYEQNCAACHGQGGAGDGVFAEDLARQGIAGHTGTDMEGQNVQPPADFTDPSQMLGASPALLQGKIIRGGMGTGMPYWGPIFTEEEVWSLVDYLYLFQFQQEVDP